MDEKLVVAVIPDGNRRYAKSKNLPISQGHILGAKVMEKFLDYCNKRIDVEEVIIFCLSEENLNRPQIELKPLWKLYERYLKRYLKNKEKNKIRIRVLSTAPNGIPNNLWELCKKITSETKSYTKKCLTLLLNWSAENEILKHFKLNGKLICDSHPHMIIRTAGERRISNFLLAQTAYTELIFEDKFFPDCDVPDFARWFDEFYSRNKRHGE